MVTRSSRESTPATITAVAYYRMSSDRQELSIPQQVQAVERYAAEHGYRIVRDYRDEGISGDATEKRHGFKQMVLDADRGDFKVVLAWDQDRIGRFDPIEAGYWLTPLRNAGVRLVTVNQGEIDLDDFAGQIVYSVTQAAKHAFLKDMAKAVARGKFHLAESGRWVSGDGPFGYKVEDGKLVPDPEEAAIVRRIYADYDAGFSLRAIADRLNREGVVPVLKRRHPEHSRASDHWSAQVIKPILANPANIGTYRYNTLQRGKYARVRGGMVAAVRRGEAATRDDAHAIVIENAHEPIVPRELFDRVNAKLGDNQKRTSRVDVPNALTGLCRCGFCGGRMSYNTQRYRDRVYRYLACSNNLTRGPGACDKRTVREEVILSTVTGVIRDRLLDPENADGLRRAIENRVRDRNAPRELDSLRRELVTLEDEIAKARRRVVEVDSDMLGIVQEHLRDLRRKHEQASERVAALEWQIGAGAEDVESTVNAALREAERIGERLNRTDPRSLREALAETVERVDLFVEARPSNGGVRSLYRLDRGRVTLRGDAGFLPVVSDNRSSPRRNF